MRSKRALVIGIDDYTDAPLNYCANDASDIAALLAMAEYGYEIELLTNLNATRREALGALQRLFSGDADDLMLYFAGHGITTNFGTHLVSVDGDALDPGIPLDLLTRLLNSSPAKDATAIVLLDCCHAGALGIRGALNEATRPMSPVDVSANVPGLGTGKVLFAACLSSESAAESHKLGHGLFTYHLIEALCGAAADRNGAVTAPNVFDYISEHLQLSDSNAGQTPVLKGDIVGRLVIGSGLPPRDRSEPPESEINRIENKARALVDDYVRQSAMGLDEWRHHGFKDACMTLEPLLRWFDSPAQSHPKLRARTGFKAAQSTARAKLADLGRLVEGLETPLGTVEKKIGSGSFGTVWRILTPSGTPVAYKIYHPTDLDNIEKRSRFDRGFRAMRQLQHPHIVPVHVLTECPVGFTMDFIEGQNARDFAAAVPEPLDALRQLLTVAETLQHAHTRQVIHRDVKPENLIMAWDPQKQQYFPYLTDFDLAWFSTATQFTREGVGSLIYAAPEQIEKPRSTAAHEPTTDVYAFGQLMFFLLTSSDPLPHLADNSRALRKRLYQSLTEEPTRALIDLYSSCTRQDPQHRVQTFRAICDSLYSIVQAMEASSTVTPLGHPRFIEELMFTMIGFLPERRVSTTGFVSTSGRTLVETSWRESRGGESLLTLRLHAQRDFVLEGGDHRRTIKILNQRLDGALAPYREAVRQPGRQAPFETFIHLDGIPLHLGGVQRVREILTRALDVLEGAA